MGFRCFETDIKVNKNILSIKNRPSFHHSSMIKKKSKFLQFDMVNNGNTFRT